MSSNEQEARMGGPDESGGAATPAPILALSGPAGSTVHVVGTVPFSEQSARDVSEVIGRLRPAAVVVDLPQEELDSILERTAGDAWAEDAGLGGDSPKGEDSEAWAPPRPATSALGPTLRLPVEPPTFGEFLSLALSGGLYRFASGLPAAALASAAGVSDTAAYEAAARAASRLGVPVLAAGRAAEAELERAEAAERRAFEERRWSRTGALGGAADPGASGGGSAAGDRGFAAGGGPAGASWPTRGWPGEGEGGAGGPGLGSALPPLPHGAPEPESVVLAQRRLAPLAYAEILAAGANGALGPRAQSALRAAQQGEPVELGDISELRRELREGAARARDEGRRALLSLTSGAGAAPGTGPGAGQGASAPPPSPSSVYVSRDRRALAAARGGSLPSEEILAMLDAEAGAYDAAALRAAAQTYAAPSAANEGKPASTSVVGVTAVARLPGLARAWPQAETQAGVALARAARGPEPGAGAGAVATVATGIALGGPLLVAAAVARRRPGAAVAFLGVASALLIPGALASWQGCRNVVRIANGIHEAAKRLDAEGEPGADSSDGWGSGDSTSWS